MGAGIEDVVAVKALETGCVPPVANFKEVDPELGRLNLSKGGAYPVEYALRLGAGFGSQIGMTLMRRVGARDAARPSPDALGYACRIEDRAAWNAWLERAAGSRAADLEVVKRTLRIRDQGAAAGHASAGGRSGTGPRHRTSGRVLKPSWLPRRPKPRRRKSHPAEDPVKQRILALVAEKTGYPADMLALDLDLEADLGVDTVKQAEVFAAVREAYGIAREDKLKLRDFPTLAHVIRFVHERRPDLAVAASAPATAPAPAAPIAAAVPVPDADPVKSRILELVAAKTGYPADMLALDLDLEADLGVDTVKQAEVFAAVREAYGIARDEKLKLRDFPTLAHVIRFVHERRPELAVAASAPATAPAPAAPVAAAVPVPDADPVKSRILELVAAKTGYPADMLALDLDLEADLGVDTVKQAEVFAAVREAYGIARDEKLKLRDFPTLAHVIRFVHERRPELAVAASAPATAPAPAAPVAAAVSVPDADPVKSRILELVAAKTGYPADMLDLDLDLEADLGVDTVKQAEVFAAVREAYGIAREENLKLRDFPTLAHVIRFVHERRPELAVAPPPAAPAGPVEPSRDSAAADPIAERVLELVVEKTGYPKDMLDLELDLEADLGVDTVKQAEMLAAIREIYAIPRDASLKLRDFPTLAHVIRFVKERRPDISAAPPQAAAPAPEAPSPAPPPQAEDPILDKVLEIVAEKTGYPRDMLDPDLDLEADLGIDTVKQAEMFASVRAAFAIPREADLKLRDFPTLAHVIRFARERSRTEPAAGDSGPAVTAAPVPASFDEASRIPRRVPVPELRPPLALSKPTGAVLGPGRRVVIMSDQGGAGEALAARLRSMDVEVTNIEDAAQGPVHGIYWLPALDPEGDLGQMDLSQWRAALGIRVKSLYTTMRALYDQIASQGTFLVSATRLGGQHGYDEAGAAWPLGGAVAGFTKTYKRERMDALVKAVDFEAGAGASEIAERLIEETLCDPGAVEVGYRDGERWTVGLDEQPAEDGQPGMTLDKDTVFLITGAAGSIVSAITIDLAAASGGTFYLLDLVPEPDPADPDLERVTSDRENLKRDLFGRIQARGERATPALVEKELASLERALAARNAIEAVRAAGGTAAYFSVDLRDPAAVAALISQIRERSGRIDVLLHAAGMERSHFLPAKEPSEFDLVFDVKADGWFNLMHAIGDMPLGATVAFSSIAGRFGNAGQADYSSANDLLCKIALSFRTTRPATRAIAIDWTAWGGIGMATRGSIPKMMELAGIDMLPPGAGVPWIRRELTAGGTRGEVVVAGRLGVLVNEWDSTGGLDRAQDESAAGAPFAPGPMAGRLAGMPIYRGLVVETTLDPTVQPFLRDHRIDGTAVLPGVMGIEAFAEAVLSVASGWHIDSIENVEFLAPFKFYRDEPRTVTVEAAFRPRGDELVADCRLLGSRQLPNHAEPQITTHFTGRVRLTRRSVDRWTASVPAAANGFAVEAADIYRLYFHGPAYQVLARTWRDGFRAVGQLVEKLPDNHVPPGLPTWMSPRLIELCFQTAGIWEMSEQNRMGLPLHIDRVRVYRAPERAEDGLLAVVTPDPDQGAFHAEVVDAAGNRYVELVGYRTVALPYALDPGLLKAVRPVRAMGAY